MVIFGVFLSPRKLNRDKCPFCGKELEYTTSDYDGDVILSPGYEKNVLGVNRSGELEVIKRSAPPRKMRGTSYQHMICPRHRYEITRITKYRRQNGKGMNSEDTYEIMRYEYRVKDFGPKISKGKQKQLERCCKNAAKDILKTYVSV